MKEISRNLARQHRLLKQSFSWITSLCFLVALITTTPASASINYHNAEASVQQSHEKLIQGQVLDKNGAPMPFVNVLIKSTTIGVMTNKEGKFSFSTQRPNPVLIFSFIGYKTIQLNVIKSQEKTLKIEMELLTEVLGDVLILGEKNHSNLATTTIKLKEENFFKRPILNVGEALQGMVPGLLVNTGGSAKPGQNYKFIIRGSKSINGSSEALVLVDGIPTSINDVDISIVKSVEILKDATATAEYGSQGVGGVILITTKRGDYGKMKVSYNSFGGFSFPLKIIKKPKLGDYLDFLNTYDPSITFTEDKISTYKEAYGNGVPWKKSIIKDKAFFTNHSVNLSGGNGLVRMALNLNYMSQDGFLPTDQYNRFQIRYNSTLDVTENIELKTDLVIRRGTKFRSLSKSTLYDLAQMKVYNPIQYNQASKLVIPDLVDGMFGKYPSYGDGINAYISATRGYHREEYEYGSIIINPIWHITNNFLIGSQISYQINGYKESNFGKTQIYLNPDGSYLRQVNKIRKGDSNASNSWYSKFYLKYRTKLNELHDLSFRAGLIDEQYTEIQYERYSELVRHSYYAKVSYIFLDKLFLNAALQYNGSSKFKNKRFGLFPSVAISYDLAKENFIKNQNIINRFSPRLSWGKQSNEPYNRYLAYENLKKDGSYSNVANPNITWEIVTEKSVGLDLSMFNYRFSLSGDIFQKNISNLILDLPITPSLGYGNATAKGNIGSMTVKGWEVNVGWSDKKDQFTYGININISDSYNYITDLGFYDEILGEDWILKPGVSKDPIYGYVTNGYYQTTDFNPDGSLKSGIVVHPQGANPGEIKYVDLGTDNTISANEDRTVIGDKTPRYLYGINLRLGYGSWGLSLLGQGIGKRDAFLSGMFRKPFNGDLTPIERFMTNTWTTDNINARYPVVSRSEKHYERDMNSHWLTNASYFRLKTTTLSYRLSKSVTKRLRIHDCMIFLTGENLLTITDFEGLDPENIGGQPYSYPNAKKISLGLNLKF